jgi:DNA polymerase elongation subunit (family B)/predicted RNA-binding Zn-ribbon protein involved in translation (DUF1610 family)
MKVLMLDIECAPNTAHVWGLFKQTVSIKQLMESSYTMCFAARWYGSKRVVFKDQYDEDMLDELWNLLNEADAVVHYNGTKYDIPTINKDFLLAGMQPPSPYKQIDLYRVVRSKFKFPSNKLDYVADRLGVGQKHAHEGHELWVKCMGGDRAAWRRMKKYNKQDVVLLGGVYDALLPWIDNHPNYALYSEKDFCCPNCGSDHVIKQGRAYTQTMTYQQYKCTDCGKWSRARLAEKGAKKAVLTQQRT